MACPETEIDLPKNEANTCWWLALNFVLFSKQRQELTDFLANTGPAGVPPADTKASAVASGATMPPAVRDIMQVVIRYYQGEPGTTTRNQLVEFRKAAGMGDFFNDKYNPAGFRVDNTSMQDFSEYFKKLNEYLGIPEFSVTLGTNEPNIFDVLLRQRFFVQYALEDGQLIKKFFRMRNADTLILYVPRRTKVDLTNPYADITPDTSPIEVLKEIVVPLEDSTSKGMAIAVGNISLVDKAIQATFILDGVVIARPGHFNTVVKCADSDKWIFYGSMAEGKSKIAYQSFEEMLNGVGDNQVRRNGTLFVYSRKKEDKKVVSVVPPPLGKGFVEEVIKGAEVLFEKTKTFSLHRKIATGYNKIQLEVKLAELRLGLRSKDSAIQQGTIENAREYYANLTEKIGKDIVWDTKLYKDLVIGDLIIRLDYAIQRYTWQLSKALPSSKIGLPTSEEIDERRDKIIDWKATGVGFEPSMYDQQSTDPRIVAKTSAMVELITEIKGYYEKARVGSDAKVVFQE